MDFHRLNTDVTTKLQLQYEGGSLGAVPSYEIPQKKGGNIFEWTFWYGLDVLTLVRRRVNDGYMTSTTIFKRSGKDSLNKCT